MTHEFLVNDSRSQLISQHHNSEKKTSIDKTIKGYTSLCKNNSYWYSWKVQSEVGLKRLLGFQ